MMIKMDEQQGTSQSEREGVAAYLTSKSSFVNYVVNAFKAWKRGRMDWEQMWADGESRWMLNTPRKSREWMSNVPPTETNFAVEGAFAEIKTTLFGGGQGDYFDVKRTGREESLLPQKQWLKFRLDSQIKLRHKAGGDHGLRTLLIKGSCAGRVTWKQQQGAKVAYIPSMTQDGRPDFTPQVQVGTTIDRPDVEFIPLENLYIEPNCKNFTAAAKIYIEDKPAKTAQEEYGVKDEELDTTLYPGTTEEEQKRKRTELGLPDSRPARDREMVECLHYYTWASKRMVDAVMSGGTADVREIPEDDNDEAFYHFIIINQKILADAVDLSDQIIPDPFFLATYLPVEGEYYGLGIPYVMKGLQDEVKDIKDLSLDNLKLRLYTPMKYKPRPTIDKLMLRIEPLALLPDNTGEDLSFMEVPDATASALAREQSVLNQIQDVTHVNKLIGGSTGGLQGVKSATGQSILRQQSAKAFEVLVEWIGENMIVPILERVYALDRQYTTLSTVAQIMGADFATRWEATSPAVFYPDVDINFVQATDLVSNEFKANTWRDIINIIMKMPTANVMEAVRRLINAMGEDDTNLFFPPQLMAQIGVPTPPGGAGQQQRAPGNAAPAGGGSGTGAEYMSPNMNGGGQ